MSWQDLGQRFRLDHALIERWQQLDAIEQELRDMRETGDEQEPKTRSDTL